MPKKGTKVASKGFRYIPETPGGSVLMDLESKTETEAWEKLLDATAHMNYGSIESLKQRGYKVTPWRK